MQVSVGTGLRRHALQHPKMPLISDRSGTEVARHVRALTFLAAPTGGPIARSATKSLCTNAASVRWQLCNHLLPSSRRRAGRVVHGRYKDSMPMATALMLMVVAESRPATPDRLDYLRSRRESEVHGSAVARSDKCCNELSRWSCANGGKPMCSRMGGGTADQS